MERGKQNLFFRSLPELKIAEILDDVQLLGKRRCGG